MKEKKVEETSKQSVFVINKLLDSKFFILKFILFGAIVGFLLSVSIPKEYSSKVVLITNETESSRGNMGLLASMAGINLGSSSDNVISTDIYPEVLSSTSFVQSLFDVRVSDNKLDIDNNLYNFYKYDQKQAWWRYILKIPGYFFYKFSKNGVEKDTRGQRVISEEEMRIIDDIRKSYSINTDKKTNITTINVTTQSPTISGFLAEYLTSRLQDYIIEERTKKAKASLMNSLNIYNQAKSEYYESQKKLATFVDVNKNVVSSVYRINQEKLQNEVDITFALYNQISQQVQLNKIKVQDDTPIFTIIQPPIELVNPSYPNKKMFMFTFSFLFLVGSCVFVLREEILKILF